MKGAIGKAVDGEDIKPALGQEGLELGQLARVLRERLGGDVGRSATHPIAAAGEIWRFTSGRYFSMGRAGLGPGLASVNVGAIGEVRAACGACRASCRLPS